MTCGPLGERAWFRVDAVLASSFHLFYPPALLHSSLSSCTREWLLRLLTRPACPLPPSRRRSSQSPHSKKESTMRSVRSQRRHLRLSKPRTFGPPADHPPDSIRIHTATCIFVRRSCSLHLFPAGQGREHLTSDRTATYRRSCREEAQNTKWKLWGDGAGVHQPKGCAGEILRPGYFFHYAAAQEAHARAHRWVPSREEPSYKGGGVWHPDGTNS